jgi:hypothetical protein
MDHEYHHTYFWYHVDPKGYGKDLWRIVLPWPYIQIGLDDQTHDQKNDL